MRTGHTLEGWVHNLSHGENDGVALCVTIRLQVTVESECLSLCLIPQSIVDLGSNFGQIPLYLRVLVSSHIKTRRVAILSSFTVLQSLI